MARKNSSTVSDEELEAGSSGSARRSTFTDESPLDARMLDLDDEAESAFLRGQRRIPVRRGPIPLPRNTSGKLKLFLIAAAILAAIVMIWVGLNHYGTQSWRFRIDSSDNISVAASHNVTRAQVLEVMAGDIERNIFFVPLDQRKRELEQIPWVKSATVMRLLPNRLKIVITERTPVAFVEIGSRVELIDAAGVIMEPPSGQGARYSFPVIVGMSDSDPLSMRAARMKIYTQFIKQLDSTGAHYSSSISDVDVSDPDDVKATVTDAHGAVLVHLGSTKFLERFQTYVSHVQEWRTQFPGLQSISLRYDHQVIVNPDLAVPGARASNDAIASASAATVAPEHLARGRSNRKSKKHN
jgi:cell division protein FtsQ